MMDVKQNAAKLCRNSVDIIIVCDKISLHRGLIILSKSEES